MPFNAIWCMKLSIAWWLYLKILSLSFSILNVQYHRILPSFQFRNENDWGLMISLMKKQSFSGDFFWGLASNYLIRNIRLMRYMFVRIYMTKIRQKYLGKIWERSLFECVGRRFLTQYIVVHLAVYVYTMW